MFPENGSLQHEFHTSQQPSDMERLMFANASLTGSELSVYSESQARKNGGDYLPFHTSLHPECSYPFERDYQFHGRQRRQFGDVDYHILSHVNELQFGE
jgi:hypothetical protein